MQANIRRKQVVDRSRALFGALVSLLGIVSMLLLVSSTETFAGAQTSGQARKESGAPLAPMATTTPAPEGKIVFAAQSEANPSGMLASINANGSGFTTFVDGSAGTGHTMPKWSHDGTHVAFRMAPPTGGSQIYTVDANGGNLFNVNHGDNLTALSPEWSPDGTKIVFQDGFEIWVINANGTNVHKITHKGSGESHDNPIWSPDGTRIAYLKYTSGQATQIILVNPDGSNPVPLVVSDPNAYRIAFLAWSPNGTKFAFQGSNNGFSSGFHVYTMDANGSNVHLADSGLRTSSFPTWSPNGLFLAMTGDDTEDPDDFMKIFVVGADGSNLHPIYAATSDDENPGWLTWGMPLVPPVVKVLGEDELPVEGAQVFHNCELVGTTNVSGTLTLNNAVTIDDELVARAAVYTGTTQKGSHDGWAYEVWLTNILQNNDGTESPYVVTDTSRMTHTLKLLPTNAQIGFNIVASVEYNTTPEHLGQIEAGFKSASEYLMDATDGQMFFEKVKLYEDKQHFDDADFQFRIAVLRANADTSVDGISSLTSPDMHIRMAGPNDYDVPYDQPDAYTTLIHEFGHYAIGALDEYYKWNHDDYPAQCTADLGIVPYEVRASIMYNHEATTEFCATLPPILHNDDTAQGYIHGESVWETLVDNWSSDEELWELRSPMTRGAANRGPVPDFITCSQTMGTVVETVTVPGEACAPFHITADYSNHDPAVGADLFFVHNGEIYDLRPIDSAGIGSIVGASIGETVTVATLVNGVPYNARTVLTNCHTFNFVLLPNFIPRQSDNSEHATVSAWPAYWLTAVPNWALNRMDVTLHLAGDAPATPTLSVRQSGGSRQEITLVYNSAQHEYAGSYTFNANLAPDFKFDLSLPVSGGAITSAYEYTGGQFHTTGPNGYEKMKNLGAPHGNSPEVAPVAWGLLRPESMADVIVSSSSLPNGTGVLVGEAGMPADAPAGLLAVGGPYSVQGQNAINGEIGITLEYLSEHYCGLVPGSTSIYRYTGSGWQAIPTTLVEDWHLAGGKINQWGIYAVFAQINPLATFSDVPSGSTFYDYINWITCHGIAGGYSDGTFRPSNNATRGQISKMMALTYKWHLDPPESSYTFADVLPGSTFFLFVEAAYREGVVSGYACGGAGEPCDAQNRPYFRPANNVTRGQIAKIISNGSKFADAVNGQTFEDVAPGSTFYEFVGRMASRSIINGYACGGPGEPCGSGNKPYFRPQSNATRGQLSKMIYLAAQPR